MNIEETAAYMRGTRSSSIRRAWRHLRGRSVNAWLFYWAVTVVLICLVGVFAS